MAEDKPTLPFSIQILAQLGGRLFDHAEALAAFPELEPITHPINVVTDLRLAARACSSFATLQFRVSEITAMAFRQDAAGNPPRLACRSG
jgi:hypothetical protein